MKILVVEFYWTSCFFISVSILIASFYSYELVTTSGHPWLPGEKCPGCSLCGLTRSVCAMSEGRFSSAFNHNKMGPFVYVFCLGFIGLYLHRFFRLLTRHHHNTKANEIPEVQHFRE